MIILNIQRLVWEIFFNLNVLINLKETIMNIRFKMSVNFCFNKFDFKLKMVSIWIFDKLFNLNFQQNFPPEKTFGRLNFVNACISGDIDLDISNNFFLIDNVDFEASIVFMSSRFK